MKTGAMKTDGISPETDAARLLAAFDGNTQVPPLSDAAPLTLDQGYAISARIAAARAARGEQIVGRKIGFTNRTIWPIYNVDAPVWSWVWDSGLHDIPEDGCIALPPRPEPRLEPEIVLGFARTPEPGMDAAALLACLDWIAHGAEIVTSLYPGWRFTAPDAAAAQAMHASLWIGPRLPATRFTPGMLAGFSITLEGPGTRLEGRGSDVLDSPLHAALHLVAHTAALPGAHPIRAGEVVTTGTLTDAVPVARGQRWRTTLKGLPLPGLDLTLT